jgi:hypothetical protein
MNTNETRDYIERAPTRREPALPLALRTTITVIDGSTSAVQADAWASELNALYDAHFDNPNPTWTWNDVHDCDRDVFIELEEVVRARKLPPTDLDLVSSFRNIDWRKPYQKLAAEIPLC